MNIINQRLTLPQFQQYVQGFNFGPNNPSRLVIHHTWKPTIATWQGERSMLGLKGYYERKGWNAGPHLFIAEDGIWLFTPMNQTGIHAGSLNLNSIGIEVVGNYDEKKWSGKTKQNSLGAIKALMNQLNLSNSDLFFHRDVSAKSCPGNAITKEWLFDEIKNFRLMPIIPTNPIDSSEDDELVIVKVPKWAKEAVEFVVKNDLFEIRSKDDLRDAVKFHRFYQLIDKEFPVENE